MEKECLEFFHDTIEDWQYIVEKYHDFEAELYEKYFNKHKVVPFEVYQELCNQYIHQAKEDNKKQAIEFFMTVYKDYPVEFKPHTDYLKPATKEEIEQARKDFSSVKEEIYGKTRVHTHTFSDGAQVLDYRGLRLILDNEWDNAWIKDETGKVHYFQLIWDWDFPIDNYIAYHIL